MDQINDVQHLFTRLIFQYLLMRQWKKAHSARRSLYSLTDTFVLEVIGNWKKITSKEISRFLGVVPSVVSDITQGLHGDGLIEEIAGVDGRTKPWQLTPEGKKVLDESRQVCVGSLDHLIVCLDTNEKTELQTLLKKLLGFQTAELENISGFK